MHSLYIARYSSFVYSCGFYENTHAYVSIILIINIILHLYLTHTLNIGEVYVPNEVFECTQTLKADFNTYLRLWGDRGWVYEKHHKARYPLIERVNGQYIELDTTSPHPTTTNNNATSSGSTGGTEYICISKANTVFVYSGPSLNNNKIQAGEAIHTCYTYGMKVYICGMFKEYSDNNTTTTSNNHTSNIRSDIMFYKLADGSGWVPSQDYKTKAPLFEKVVA